MKQVTFYLFYFRRVVIVQCKVTKDAEEIQPTVTQIIKLPTRNATTAGVNFINFIRARFLYERRTRNVHVTRKKAAEMTFV